jgi:hypothetical protein
MEPAVGIKLMADIRKFMAVAGDGHTPHFENTPCGHLGVEFFFADFSGTNPKIDPHN